MMRTGLQRIEENVEFLRSVPLLKHLDNSTLSKIADTLELVRHKNPPKVSTTSTDRARFCMDDNLKR